MITNIGCKPDTSGKIDSSGEESHSSNWPVGTSVEHLLDQLTVGSAMLRQLRLGY